MTHESEPTFLARRQRQRQQFFELGILDSGAKELLAIDKFRRERGGTTEVGDAIRTIYGKVRSRGPQQQGLFNRIKNQIPFVEQATALRDLGQRVGDIASDVGAQIGRVTTLDPTDIIGSVLTNIDRPGGAVRGAASVERFGDVPGAFVAGAVDPASTSGRNVVGIRLLPDEDILGPISPRDVAGMAFEIGADPVDIPLGGLIAVDVAKGGVKGAKALIRRFAKKGVPSASRRAVPTTPVADIVTDIIPVENAPIRQWSMELAQKYEGKLNTQGLEVQRDLDLGNLLLKDLDIGQKMPKGRFVERSEDVEQLFLALHNEADKALLIARGEDAAGFVDAVVPAKWAPVFDELRRQVDLESLATLQGDTKMMANPEYFPRGFAPREGFTLGTSGWAATPGFKMPRVDATFREMLEAGWEPASWNPFEMVARRRTAGAEYREQRELLRFAKEHGVALKVEGPIPDGWRVPRVGAAFEGRTLLLEESGQTVLSPRWAVPSELADIIESQAGLQATLRLGNVDILPALRAVNNTTKRVKLLGSFFQQVDFGMRVGAFTTFNGAYEALRAGQPLTAVTRLVSLPKSMADLAFANVSSQRRRMIRDQILSGDVIWPERPGITLRGISEHGWKTFDSSLVDRNIRATLEQAVGAPPPGTSMSVIKKAGERILEVEQAFQRGLFDGWYPQSQIIALKNLIIPNLIRTRSGLTDEQIMLQAATDVNIMFSTLGDFQQFAKSPAGKDLLRLTMFSSNESESLIRASFAPFKGDRKAFWTANWASAVLFIGMIAETVHFAVTKEHLPAERFLPLEFGGPLGVRYRSSFLAPTIAKTLGRGGVEISMDLIGQLDTGLRLFEPWGFMKARLSVPLRAGLNQLQGADFFGRPLDTPAERGQQVVSDLGVPISTGNILGAAGIGPVNEARLGVAGQLIQATGVNLRAETTPDLLERKAQEQFGKAFDDLEPFERRQLDEDEALKAELDQRRETSAIRGSEGALRAIQVEEAREREQAEQLAADAQLDAGQLSARTWREQRRRRQDGLRGELTGIFADTERGEPTDARGRLGEKIAEFTDETGQVDWDRVDAWIGGLPKEDQEFIARNTGLSDTPKEAEYRKVLAEADAFGYFEFGDRAWAHVLSRAPEAIKPGIEPFASFGEWFQAAVTTRAEQIGAAPGASSQQARADINGLPVVKEYRDAINILQRDLIVTDTPLADRLTLWDLLTTQEVERRFIAGALQ